MKLEYVYASMLLNALKQKISEKNIRNIITAIGVTPDDEQIATLIQILKDVNIDEILSQAHVVYVQGAEQPIEAIMEPDVAVEAKTEEVSQGLDVLFGTYEEKKSDESESLS